MKGILLVVSVLIVAVVLSLSGQPYVSYMNYGSTGLPVPAVFSCPNDGTTGTATGVPVKISASNTCISVATADAQAAAADVSVIGICVSNCTTSGNALIAPFGPIVPCLFENATTFGHWAILGQSAIGCRDNGSGAGLAINTVSQTAVGMILDTGSAGVHNVVAVGWKNPGRWFAIANVVTRLDMASFNGQFLLRKGDATAGVCQQFGSSTAGPALSDSGSLLKVLNANTNCGSGDGNLGVGHLSSDNAAPPTIGSGFGTSPAIVSGGDLSFIVNVGTGGVATSGVANFGTSFTTAPACQAQDSTTAVLQRAVATTGAVTITSASAWTASDKLIVQCFGQNGL